MLDTEAQVLRFVQLDGNGNIELTDAMLINPYATDHFADAIRKALGMPREEKQRRMRRMREEVRENNIYKWAADIISDLVKFRTGK